MNIEEQIKFTEELVEELHGHAVFFERYNVPKAAVKYEEESEGLKEVLETLKGIQAF